MSTGLPRNLAGLLAKTRADLLEDLLNEALRALLVEDPKSFLARYLGEPLPDEIDIEILEESADTIYIVLPDTDHLEVLESVPDASLGATETTRLEFESIVVRNAIQSPSYRAELLRDPRQTVLRHHKLDIPDWINLRALEDSSETVHLVLPHHADDGEELSDADLEAVAGGKGNIFGSGRSRGSCRPLWTGRLLSVRSSEEPSAQDREGPSP